MKGHTLVRGSSADWFANLLRTRPGRRRVPQILAVHQHSCLNFLHNAP
jgi:hypothetical protein